MHKAAFSCAYELCMRVPTDKYVRLVGFLGVLIVDRYVWYCVRRVQMLLAASIKPILVFDGGRLPAKKGTEEDRRK